MAVKRLFMEYHVKQNLPVQDGKMLCQNGAESSVVFPEKPTFPEADSIVFLLL